jgi:hypothetical protein
MTSKSTMKLREKTSRCSCIGAMLSDDARAQERNGDAYIERVTVDLSGGNHQGAWSYRGNPNHIIIRLVRESQ